jgi:hypothetical protein
MNSKKSQVTVEGFMHNLLFHQDPDTRMDAALQLGGETIRIADQRLALEALTLALQDPCSTVQEAVLQSLMRISAKNGQHESLASCPP